MTLSSSSGPARKGFTLIELLCVIAIVALLAAILFPVFSQARENARRSSCSSNLRQIGFAINQYTQDYDERYPSVFVDTNVKTIIDVWKVLQPYTKSEAIFECPSDSRGEVTDPVECTYQGSCLTNGHHTSYGFNAGGAYGEPYNVMDATPMNGLFPMTVPVGSGQSIVQGALLAQVENPSEIYVAADAFGPRRYGSGVDRYQMNTMGWRAYAGTTAPSTQSGWRHRNQRNTLYADGHVKPVKWITSNRSGLLSSMPAKDSDFEGFCVTPSITIYGALLGNPPGYDCAVEIKSLIGTYRPSPLPE